MQTEQVVFCIQCGTMLPAKAKFCFRCGTVLPTADVKDSEEKASENADEAIGTALGSEYDTEGMSGDVQKEEMQEAEQAETSSLQTASLGFDWKSIILTPEEEAGLTSRQKRELKRRKAREMQQAEIQSQEDTDKDVPEDGEAAYAPTNEADDEENASHEDDEKDVYRANKYEIDAEIDDTVNVDDKPSEVMRAQRILEQFGVQPSSMHGQFFFAPVIVSNNATLMDLIQRCTIIPQTPQDENLISAIKTMPPYKAQQAELLGGWGNELGGQLMSGMPLQSTEAKTKEEAIDTPAKQEAAPQPPQSVSKNSMPTAPSASAAQSQRAQTAVLPPPQPVQERKPVTQPTQAQRPAPPHTRPNPAPVRPANQQQATSAQRQQQPQRVQQPRRESSSVKASTNRGNAEYPNQRAVRTDVQQESERKFRGRIKKEKKKPVEDEEEEYNYYDGMAEDDGRERKDVVNKDDKKTTIIKMTAVLVGTALIIWLMLSVIPNVL